MAISKQQLNRLKDILIEEYGFSLSEEDLAPEALRLSDFAKTILRNSLIKK